MPTSGLSAVVGRAKEEFSPNPLNYDEMRPGCYDPVARLDDMDRAGVLASLCFPTLPRFCGQLFFEHYSKHLVDARMRHESIKCRCRARPSDQQIQVADGLLAAPQTPGRADLF